MVQLPCCQHSLQGLICHHMSGSMIGPTMYPGMLGASPILPCFLKQSAAIQST